MGIHGGDIYRNHVIYDFSVNVNPLGMPDCVREALHRAVDLCGRYPDMRAERLKKAVGSMLAVPEEYLLFGNGASELLMAAAHGIRAEKTVIPVPSFYGYEYAAGAAGSEIVYYEITTDDLCLTEDVGPLLTEDTGAFYLARPNNPTGNLIPAETLRALLGHCKERGICVVLDECFIEFCGNGHSMIREIEDYDNLILIRAFTKIFAIPGVRLGYLICKDQGLRAKIAAQLPEWNLSCFAQEAGVICAGQTDFIRETAAYIERERCFLEKGLREKGFRLYPAKADFILFYTEQPLYEKLLAKGILIRDCSSFRGLGKGFYRTAVKSREENEILLENL